MGMMGIKWTIWKAKFVLLLRIKDQETTSLCKQVYEESSSRGWPGLGEEVSDICMKIGIPDVNSVVVSKEDIKDAIYTITIIVI